MPSEHDDPPSPPRPSAAHRARAAAAAAHLPAIPEAAAAAAAAGAAAGGGAGAGGGGGRGGGGRAATTWLCAGRCAATTAACIAPACLHLTPAPHASRPPGCQHWMCPWWRSRVCPTLKPPAPALSTRGSGCRSTPRASWRACTRRRGGARRQPRWTRMRRCGLAGRAGGAPRPLCNQPASGLLPALGGACHLRLLACRACWPAAPPAPSTRPSPAGEGGVLAGAGRDGAPIGAAAAGAGGAAGGGCAAGLHAAPRCRSRVSGRLRGTVRGLPCHALPCHALACHAAMPHPAVPSAIHPTLVVQCRNCRPARWCPAGAALAGGA